MKAKEKMPDTDKKPYKLNKAGQKLPTATATEAKSFLERHKLLKLLKIQPKPTIKK